MKEKGSASESTFCDMRTLKNSLPTGKENSCLITGRVSFCVSVFTLEPWKLFLLPKTKVGKTPSPFHRAARADYGAERRMERCSGMKSETVSPLKE